VKKLFQYIDIKYIDYIKLFEYIDFLPSYIKQDYHIDKKACVCDN